MPLSWRARQWWEAMPRSQRVNRLLYGLALVSMLGLLAELGLGSPETDTDLVSAPAERSGNPTTTRRTQPPAASSLPDTPAVPGGVTLADILAQVAIPSIPDAPGGGGASGGGGSGSGATGAGAPAGPRAPATTAAPRSQPSGGGGGSPAPSSPATPTPTQAPAQPKPPPDPDPDPGPAPTSPTTPPSQPPQTTRPTTVPRTTPTFPDFSIPTQTTACTRRC